MSSRMLSQSASSFSGTAESVSDFVSTGEVEEGHSMITQSH